MTQAPEYSGQAAAYSPSGFPDDAHPPTRNDSQDKRSHWLGSLHRT